MLLAATIDPLVLWVALLAATASAPGTPTREGGDRERSVVAAMTAFGEEAVLARLAFQARGPSDDELRECLAGRRRVPECAKRLGTTATSARYLQAHRASFVILPDPVSVDLLEVSDRRLDQIRRLNPAHPYVQLLLARRRYREDVRALRWNRYLARSRAEVAAGRHPFQVGGLPVEGVTEATLAAEADRYRSLLVAAGASEMHRRIQAFLSQELAELPPPRAASPDAGPR